MIISKNKERMINMKKLLGLLSVLTISGTAIPTVIAVSPVPIQNNNSLENLNRSKRQSTTIIESTTTAIPNTTFSIRSCDVVLESNPERWGNNFILRFSPELSQIIRGLTSVKVKEILVAIIASIGGSAVGALTSDSPLTITLSGVIPGVATLFVALINRFWPSEQQRQAFINFFRNNDGSNGLNLAVNENPIDQISITSTAYFSTRSSSCSL
jgi:hypothetical protein